jgi:hypothetical protein
MNHPATSHTLADDGNGGWSLTGVWVIENFPSVTHAAPPAQFQVANDLTLTFRFLNPLNRSSIRVSLIVFLSSAAGDYPVDLEFRIVNSRRDLPFSAARVTYSPSALRSYVTFDVKWSELTEADGFCDSGRLRLEFRVRHSARRSRAVAAAAPPARRPRAIGLHSDGRTDALDSVVVILYHIPRFRAFVYRIAAAPDQAVFSLQRVFAELQGGGRATSGDLPEALHWESGALRRWTPLL